MSKYSWAKALAPGHMGMGPKAQGPMPMCPGARALADEYFDIWAHKYSSHTGFFAYLILACHILA